MLDRQSLDEVKSDLSRWWRQMPDKGVFFVLLAAWLALFHLLGNSTFGYHKSSSLFSWMHYVFTTSPDDDYCLYVPLVVVGLLIWKRRELMATPVRLWWPGVGLVALALALHIAGYAVQQARISILAFALGLYGLTGLVWGTAWLKNTFFPMFLLVFLVPLGTMSEALTVPLRLVATSLSVGFSHTVLGIPVYQNGAQILGAQQTPLYEVAPACSGIRSLISMLMLMVIFSFASFRTWWRRGVLLFSAIPVAILGNVLRLVTVILVGEAMGAEAAMKIEQKLGFLTFALGIVVMLGLGHWLRETPPAPAAPEPKDAAP